jgi:hypothetical protein
VGGWSFQSLKARFVDHALELVEGEGTIRLGEYLMGLERRELARAAGHASPQHLYLRNIFLKDAIPALFDEVRLPFFVGDNWLAHLPLSAVVPPQWRRWVEFFASGSGMRFPFIHADTHQTHAWIAQVVGSKRAWLWPPRYRTQGARLKDNLINVEVDGDTDLSAAMGHASPAVVDFHAGDLLFIPAGWWHTVEAQSLSLTVSGNFVNASNWDDFYAFNVLAARDADDDDVRAVGAAVMAFAPGGVFPR